MAASFIFCIIDLTPLSLFAEQPFSFVPTG